MGPIMTSLGAACFVTICLTMIGRTARRDLDDTWVSLGLVAMWGIGGVWGILQDGSDLAFWSGPMEDLPFGLWVASRHFRYPAAWKIAVVIICALQMTFHVAFGISDKSPLTIYGYKAALNITSVAQMVCVASSGVSHGIRRLLRSMSPRAMVRDQRSGGRSE